MLMTRENEGFTFTCTTVVMALTHAQAGLQGDLQFL